MTQRVKAVKTKIEVTEKHLKEGKPDKCSDCPVARAIRSAGFKNPVVYGDIAYFYKGKTRYTANLPKKVDNFISRFDTFGHDKTYKPFSFMLVPVV